MNFKLNCQVVFLNISLMSKCLLNVKFFFNSQYGIGSVAEAGNGEELKTIEPPNKKFKEA